MWKLVLGLAYPGNSSRHVVRSLVHLVVVSWRERLHPHRQTENKAREQVVGVG